MLSLPKKKNKIKMHYKAMSGGSKSNLYLHNVYSPGS